ncbi:hypothetical protein EW026_g7806 [Hermanssonia centrifuga]|uniref:Retrotransposon gag domain-containing protein n=1 Tax=Hermanssonia centrifuga TaxID=98765 RepID=A0A4S4K6L0_9APHY|nr:hypothetical protein EW026_g7806 [Hermanssonia centrifuga]
MEDLQDFVNFTDQVPRDASMHPDGVPDYGLDDPEGQTPYLNAHAMMNAVIALGRHQGQFAEYQARANGLLDTLTQRLVDPQSQPRPPLPTGQVRFHEPRVFNGKAEEVVPFLREIKNAVHLQRRVLLDDYDKVIYMSTYLKDGSPSSWYNALDVRRSPLLFNFEGFVEDFKHHFEDSDLLLPMPLVSKSSLSTVMRTYFQMRISL